jgi:integrase/recombinase XerC
MTGREALAAWLEHLANERRSSPRTLEAYGFAARRYVGFLEQHRGEAIDVSALAEVTAGEVRAWLAHLRQGDKPLSPRSLSQALSAIRTFHRFLDRRLDAPNPAIALVRGPRVKPGAPRPVTEDQAVGMIAEPALDPDREDWEVARDQAVLTLLYGCGLRISEALSLKRSDAPVMRGDALSNRR